jgi:aspartyl-tRNA(Asn)/glutamyl-tRNA(Gln) amidotransferase subunit C
MSIERDTVLHAAHLARIKLPEDRVDGMTEELNGIVAWVEELASVDTDGVAPMTSAVEMKAHWRADAITDGGYPDRVTANAPEPQGDFFTVPKVVE